MSKEYQIAKTALESLIAKARVHLYKPIQIAEILYRDRVSGDINLNQIETYRTSSRKWRDVVCIPFLGRTSTSSARYQDDLFQAHAVPPDVLSNLGIVNRKTEGGIEAFIYSRFYQRYQQLYSGLAHCQQTNFEAFELQTFLNLFWLEKGLRRSIDKVYEIIVYALFTGITEEIGLSIHVEIPEDRLQILQEFSDFANRVLGISEENSSFRVSAQFHRVGATNAADRGLDMWSNYGLAVQIKHLSLNVEMARSISQSVTANKIVIVCKKAEESVISSVLNQLGWMSRIQSIITEEDLLIWYTKALRGKYSSTIGPKILHLLREELSTEFPVVDATEFDAFYTQRNYPSALKQLEVFESEL